MTAKIMMFRLSVLIVVLCAISFWIFSSEEKNESTIMVEKSQHSIKKNIGAEKSISSVDPKSVNSRSADYIPDGITFDIAKQTVSINVKKMARLLIVQRIAEVAHFDFSLPDQAIDYWSEPVGLVVNDQPLTAALSTVIGAQPYTLEMSYDAAISLHKISAVFLTANSKKLATQTPLDKKIPLQAEREISEAPDVNFSANNEQQLRRANFFSADDQTRVAILQEMSPVGTDLDYIVTSLQRDKNAFVRAAAAQRLSVSGSYLATQSLLEALSDADPGVVKAAANSLITLGDASVIPAMEAKLGGSEQGKAILQEANQRIQSRFSLASDGNH